MKAGLGMTAGAVGSFIGTPAEISLIRMTADGRYIHQLQPQCAEIEILFSSRSKSLYLLNELFWTFVELLEIKS